MWWTELISGFLGALIGAGATILFQRWNDRKNVLTDGRFNIYTKLLDLKSEHFWILSSDIRGENPDREVVEKFDRLRCHIADEIRKVDELPEAEDIIRTLFSLTFKSESQRSKALSRILDRLGKQVNPKYDRLMKEITEENLFLQSQGEYYERLHKVQTPWRA